MSKFILVLAGALSSSVFVQPADAQSYIPAGSALSPEKHRTIEKSFTAPSSIDVDDPLTCTNPPALTDLSTLNVVRTTMSSSSAVNLGIVAGIGSGNGKVSANTQVFVQDWSVSAPCLSTDGKTRLLYGQAIRIVATIEGVEAKTDLSLAVIAAEATLNKKSTSLQGSLIGVKDDEARKAISGLGGPLNVETFGNAALFETIAKKVLDAKTGSPAFLGVVPGQGDVGQDVAGAYAAQQIALGKTCLDAKSKLPISVAARVARIEAVYIALTGSCGASPPDNIGRARGQEALMGLKIK